MEALVLIASRILPGRGRAADESIDGLVDKLGADASMAFVGNTEHSLPYMLKHSDLFDAFREEDDTFWEKLFLLLRDMGCEEIQIRREKVVSVQCAGEERQLTLADLEENILEDYGDILHTQTAIPDTILFEEDKKMLMYVL